jgi:phosphonate transport system substrate-binding protein
MLWQVGFQMVEICHSRKSTILCFNGSKTAELRRRLHFENTTKDCDRQHRAEEVAMLRLGGVASRTYLVAFPAIKQHFQQQGLELDWVLYSSWDALVEAFVRREVDVAWNGPLAYVKIKRRLGNPCQVVAMRDIDVNLVTAFITQPQSAIRTVDDLKGTRFAFGARGSVEAGLLAHHFLKQLGIEPSQDLALATFCEERPTPNADSQRDVVDRIVSGEYDAGAVSSTALARMHEAGMIAPESVRVFWTSPGYSHCCFTAHSDTDRALARQITQAFVSMAYDDPLGKTALEAEGCKAFVPGVTEGWEVLEAVAEEEGLL